MSAEVTVKVTVEEPPAPVSRRGRWRSFARRPWSRENLPWSVGILALVAGSVLRLWSIQQARFSGEESWFWSVGREIATGQAFPVLGPPISGTAARLPGAGFFWFMGLTQLGGASPLRAYAIVSLGGLVVLAPLALVVERAFDRATGVAFLILSAVSPWWVVYTNSAWPGYLFPTLCALMLIGLPSLTDGWRAVAARAPVVAQAGLMFLLVIGFQVHLSLLHYWLIVAVTVLVWRPRVTRAMVVGLALGCLCYVPYLVYELRHDFANTIAIAHRAQGPARAFPVLMGLVLYFLGFTTTDISYLWNQGFWFAFDLVRFWRGSGVQQTQSFFSRVGWAPVAWAALVISWAFTLVSWLLFLRELWRRFRARPRSEANVLLLAFVTATAGIPVFYLLSGKGGFPHYVSIVLPLAFLPPAFVLGRLLGHASGRWGAVAYLCLFAVGGWLGLRGYYAVDSRWSVPQTTAAVDFILRRTRSADGRDQRPFRLEYGFSPNWPGSYALIAKHMFKAPFAGSTARAGDLFRVDARWPGQPVATPSVNALVLPTLMVTHQRLSGPAVAR